MNMSFAFLACCIFAARSLACGAVWTLAFLRLAFLRLAGNFRGVPRQLPTPAH
jgi:hypothetical protein